MASGYGLSAPKTFAEQHYVKDKAQTNQVQRKKL